MQGHVDAIGHVEELRQDAEFHWLTVSFPPHARAAHRPQGIDRGRRHQPDGRRPRRRSLRHHGRAVHDASTRISARDQIRDRVNLECDMVGKYVVRAAELAGLTLGVRPGRDDTFEAASMSIEGIRRKGKASRASVAPEVHRRSRASRTPSTPSAPARMIIVVDDEDRENEGDLTIAAEKVTPEAINFMARYGRGLICLSMTPERLDELEIPLMVAQNSSRFDTAFCVPIEREDGTTHRHLGRRSRGDGAGGDRSGDEAGRSRAARPHVPAARAHRRRAGARRPDRSGGRSRADRRAVSGRRHLRNHERGRHDGARAAADEVREEARAADDHGRRSDQVPDAHRVAGQARRDRRSCRPTTATSACTRSRTRSTTRRTSRSCAATSATARTCWCASTRRA